MSVSAVLITGGAGFLGSHLCDHYINKGWSVYCVDNFLTGSEANIKHLLSEPHFKLIEHDIIHPLVLKDKVQLVLNFACPASPPKYQADPLHTFKTSVYGTHHMLDLAREHKAVFLQASTSEVYGDPLQHPQSESYWGNVNPIGLRSCYDEGKRAAETLTMDYQRCYGLDTRIVRIFNTYGPRMDPDDGRVVSSFIVQALKGMPLTIFGDGSQSRSFCYCSDLIRGITTLATVAGYHMPVNIGNNYEFTVSQLADAVLELTGSNSQISSHPLPSDDPQVRRPDLSKAQKLLDYKPEIQLQEGLQKTIAYFRNQLGL